MQDIVVRGARQHNLRNLDLSIPRQAITVVTGLSGSGKSSLAFDTLYAEGQRRYIESLSTYARQFLEQMEKPDVDTIDGLSPAISIEQKTTARGSRSTVGTITEVYDYLRLLFASIGVPHCPNCGREISRQSVEDIVRRILELPEGSRLTVLAPIVRERKGEFRKLFERFLKEGYIRARVDGEIVDLEEPPPLDRRRNHTIEIVVDRLKAAGEYAARIEESVRQALKIADGLVAVSVQGGEDSLFSERTACVECGIDMPALEPRSFSFNSKFGACPVCGGIGSFQQIDLDRLVKTPDRPPAEATIILGDRDFEYLFREASAALMRHFGIAADTPFNELPPELRAALRNGLPEPIEFRYGEHVYRSQFAGLNQWFRERIEHTSSAKRRQRMLSFMREADCEACGGTRLRPESRAVRVNGLSISEYCRVPLEQSRNALGEVRLSPREQRVAGPILDEIRHRVSFLVDVGLDYLTLDRRSETLSAGEAQRVRLATQIGSQLRGVLYVLDEPSIGLHPRDTQSLLEALGHLRDLGNTVVVVEHDEETIRSADHVVDLGPGAGLFGGRIVAEGTVADIVSNPESLTGAYLSGRRQINRPGEPRPGNGRAIGLKGVRHHNLADIDVSFPLGRLIAVTGVSGAGKSSLVDEVLFRTLSRHLYSALAEPGEVRRVDGLEHVDKVIEIDQSPIGRTPRSNPATYSGVFTPIRELFALLPESRMRGYKPGRFSFNVKGGRCEVCRGEGMRKIEMNFLPDVYVDCEACQGTRYNRETLSVRFKGFNISEILDMPVDRAYELLENIPPIESRLRTLRQVGLGYITLGQSSTTLSGGEAQRVKLARELSRRATGRTLYILDEPTTGLHFEDVRKLLDILNDLVDLGNTVIVIEHNLDIVKCADWVIDLGPEGGVKGGRVVAAGTPAEIAADPQSHTGRALRRVL
ncbi:MAG: excinuclease ABC subunit UvrA [Acidobacteriota bacterium]